MSGWRETQKEREERETLTGGFEEAGKKKLYSRRRL